MRIRINNRQDIVVDNCAIRKLVRDTLKKEGIKKAGIEISILLVDDEGIKKINKQYLGRDKSTDVISFRMWEGFFPSLHAELFGDVVVNVARAKQFPDFKRELGLYIAHGILHLLGYVDDTKRNAERMRKRCEEILREFYR